MKSKRSLNVSENIDNLTSNLTNLKSENELSLNNLKSEKNKLKIAKTTKWNKIFNIIEISTITFFVISIFFYSHFWTQTIEIISRKILFVSDIILGITLTFLAFRSFKNWKISKTISWLTFVYYMFYGNLITYITYKMLRFPFLDIIFYWTITLLILSVLLSLIFVPKLIKKHKEIFNTFLKSHFIVRFPVFLLIPILVFVLSIENNPISSSEYIQKNDSICEVFVTINIENDKLYNYIENDKSDDLNKLKIKTSEIIDFIDSIQIFLVKEIDGSNGSIENIKKSNSKKANDIMRKNGMSWDLQKEISNYREYIYRLYFDNNANSDFRIDLLNTEDIYGKPWSIYKFKYLDTDLSLTGVIFELNKIKSEIYQVENNLLTFINTN